MIEEDAGIGLDDFKESIQADVQRIAKHYARTDLDNIEREYHEGTHDDFLWPSAPDEAELQLKLQAAMCETIHIVRRDGRFEMRPLVPGIFHSAAKIFPLMDANNLDILRDDIQKHGLKQPIWLDPNGWIVDGRNRFIVCRQLGISPEFKRWDGRGSTLDLIWSLNGSTRNHLTKDQLAAVADEMIPLMAAEKQRAKLSGKSADGRAEGRGRKTLPSNQGKVSGRHLRSSASIAAELAGVSRNLVERIVVYERPIQRWPCRLRLDISKSHRLWTD